MAKDNKICETPFCRNKKIVEKRAGKPDLRRKTCAKCKQRKYRERHPLENYYHHLKSSAHRRGIVFSLTIEHLKEVVSTRRDFFKKTGLLGKSPTIDRIEAHLGYADGNIQVISRINNSKKYWAKDRHYNFGADPEDPDFQKDLPF